MFSVEDFSNDERVMYHSLNSPSFMVAKRDFVYLNCRATLPLNDNQQTCHVLTSVSVEHDKAPPNPDFQRGTLIISGFVIEPLNNNSACRIKYVVQADPAGYVPAFLVNFTNSSIVDRMKVMKQFILEEAAKVNLRN